MPETEIVGSRTSSLSSQAKPPPWFHTLEKLLSMADIVSEEDSCKGMPKRKRETICDSIDKEDETIHS